MISSLNLDLTLKPNVLCMFSPSPMEVNVHNTYGGGGQT